MSVEPVSPELVLVCPELRRQALAGMPPLPWEAIRDRSPERPSRAAATRRGSSSPPATGAVLVDLARIAFVTVFTCVALTLVLTLVADALR